MYTTWLHALLCPQSSCCDTDRFILHAILWGFQSSMASQSVIQVQKHDVFNPVRNSQQGMHLQHQTGILTKLGGCLQHLSVNQHIFRYMLLTNKTCTFSDSCIWLTLACWKFMGCMHWYNLTVPYHCHPEQLQIPVCGVQYSIDLPGSSIYKFKKVMWCVRSFVCLFVTLALFSSLWRAFTLTVHINALY